MGSFILKDGTSIEVFYVKSFLGATTQNLARVYKKKGFHKKNIANLLGCVVKEDSVSLVYEDEKFIKIRFTDTAIYKGKFREIKIDKNGNNEWIDQNDSTSKNIYYEDH